MPAPPMNATPRTPRSEVSALLALFAGALAIGSSGIFVRLSETGPTATAFWRGAIALPFLLIWVVLERRRRAQAGQTTARGCPQSPQKRRPGSFSPPQSAQINTRLLSRVDEEAKPTTIPRRLAPPR